MPTNNLAFLCREAGRTIRAAAGFREAAEAMAGMRGDSHLPAIFEINHGRFSLGGERS